MGVADDLTDQVEALAGKFASVDPRLLALAALLHVSNHVLRSVAWRNVLVAAYPDRRVPLTGVTAAYASGVALNALVPARGGDAAKIALARAEIELVEDDARPEDPLEFLGETLGEPLVRLGGPSIAHSIPSPSSSRRL